MTNDPLLTIFLPGALGVIMLGLGLSLTLADFVRIARFPRPVLIGLFCQVLILPLVCFALVSAAGLEPALAVGFMLLAASPGGTSANLFSHLAHGDVALNISLTAVSSVVAVLSMPLIVNLALAHFMEADQAIPLQFAKVLQVFVIVLGPVAIGMLIRRFKPGFAASMDKPVRFLSGLFLALIIVLAFINDSLSAREHFVEIGFLALLFNLASMAVGYWVPRLLRLNLRQSIAIGMEIGIHNGTLAIALALSPLLLNNPSMAIPAAIYGILAFFTAALFGWMINRLHGRELAVGA
ncbi:bile acid:sodium symporter family protein [Pseudomonas sp. N040]|uniref:bile acid:sodium symporter family protein n=1 Tax=Pseudomonas sp. N040 TaxID=2785325 RepID=UPI0018A2B9FE|nr:bile acid:sodium symporter family protein [Pseudomonas sp. N040]MBF7731600.1 bile acid:sodium symporter family protein [Pseudomonas sp. N040]MBW7015244.1 bile acid:sodium symporter family protein [Pseudomonas sp. N040]